MNEVTRMLCVEVPARVHQELKLRAVRKNVPMKDLVLRAFEATFGIQEDTDLSTHD